MEQQYFILCNTCKKYYEHYRFISVNSTKRYKTCVACRYKRSHDYKAEKDKQREEQYNNGMSLLESYGLDPYTYGYIIHSLRI